MLARAVLHDLSALHHGDVVAQFTGHAQVVGDEHHRQTELLAHLRKQLEHLFLHRHVERRNWLVRDQQFRLQRQCACNADALTLPAREFMRKAVERLFLQAHELEQI